MVFSVPTFTSVGDDYDKKPDSKKPKPGKCFVTSGPKSGNGPDVTFDKTYKSIHEGDPYVDPGTAERRAKLEASKKRVVPEGFKLANPPKKSCGLGGYFGTFQAKPIPHETDYIVPRKGESPKRKQPAARPIFTAPSRKGGPGVVGTLLSKDGTDYVADFYDARRTKEKEEHEKHVRLMKGAPWKGGGRKGYTFDENTTGTSTCYALTKPLEAKKEFKSKAEGKPQSVAWKPGGVIPTKLPPIEYREDPFDGFDPRQGPKKKAQSAEGSRPGWRPNGVTNDTWYTKSIAFHGL